MQERKMVQRWRRLPQAARTVWQQADRAVMESSALTGIKGSISQSVTVKLLTGMLDLYLVMYNKKKKASAKHVEKH